MEDFLEDLNNYGELFRRGGPYWVPKPRLPQQCRKTCESGVASPNTCRPEQPRVN